MPGLLLPSHQPPPLLLPAVSYLFQSSAMLLLHLFSIDIFMLAALLFFPASPPFLRLLLSSPFSRLVTWNSRLRRNKVYVRVWSLANHQSSVPLKSHTCINKRLGPLTNVSEGQGGVTSGRQESVSRSKRGNLAEPPPPRSWSHQYRNPDNFCESLSGVRWRILNVVNGYVSSFISSSFIFLLLLYPFYPYISPSLISLLLISFVYCLPLRFSSRQTWVNEEISKESWDVSASGDKFRRWF